MRCCRPEVLEHRKLLRERILGLRACRVGDNEACSHERRSCDERSHDSHATHHVYFGATVKKNVTVREMVTVWACMPPALRNDPGTVTIPQYRFNKNKAKHTQNPTTHYQLRSAHLSHPPPNKKSMKEFFLFASVPQIFLSDLSAPA